MNFSDVGFFLVVGTLLLLALVGFAYLRRDKLKSAFTDFLDETFIKRHGAALVRTFADHLKPIASLLEEDDSLSISDLRELKKLVDAKLKTREAET